MSGLAPYDFDWMAYRSLNPDLKHIKNKAEAIKHYLTHGYRQGRPYARDKSDGRVSTVPPDFDWIAYRSLNSDLKWIRNESDAKRHYVEHGSTQSRCYKFPNIKLESPKKQGWQQTQEDEKKKALAEINYQHNVPSDFDWISYKYSRQDLVNSIKNYQDAVSHYLNHGSGSLQKDLPLKPDTVLDRSPSDFNYLSYIKRNPELGLKTPQEAVQHYCQHGYREGRQYDPLESKVLTSDVFIKLITDGVKINTSRLTPMTPQPPHLLLTPQTPQTPQTPRPLRPIVTPKIRLIPKRKIIQPHWSNNNSIAYVGASGTIPKIVYFVYGLESNKSFEYFRYIAIRSCYDYIKPSSIHIICCHKPHGYWWDLLKQSIDTIFIIQIPETPKTSETHDTPETSKPSKTSKTPNISKTTKTPKTPGSLAIHFSHLTVKIGLEYLYKTGGIYLDLDTICCKSFDDLLIYNTVVALQTSSYQDIITPSLIMAQAGSEYIKRWLDEPFSCTPWNEWTSIRPLYWLKEYNVTILAPQSLSMTNIHKLFTNEVRATDVMTIDVTPATDDCYYLHLWESWNYPLLSNYILESSCLYTRLTRQFTSRTWTVVGSDNLVRSLMDKFNIIEVRQQMSPTGKVDDFIGDLVYIIEDTTIDIDKLMENYNMIYYNPLKTYFDGNNRLFVR